MDVISKEKRVCQNRHILFYSYKVRKFVSTSIIGIVTKAIANSINLNIAMVENTTVASNLQTISQGIYHELLDDGHKYL